MGVWVGDHYCEVDCPPCGLFEGRSGKAVVLTLTFLAFVTYVSIFTIRKRSGKDTRSWKVFWLDLMKMGIGQGCAWGINVLNSHRNSEMAAGEGESFDAVSWYFPTFLNDELIAVPLGVGLWQLLTRVVRSRGRPWGINVLSWKAFNPVPRARIGKWCFEQLARRGNRTLPLPKSTYALHLSSRLTLQYHNVQEGTLCHRLYSSHCVLCD